jgi:hypothetical protein
MTWLWVFLFVLACIVPLTAYIYVIEIREAIAADPTAEHGTFDENRFAA